MFGITIEKINVEKWADKMLDNIFIQLDNLYAGGLKGKKVIRSKDIQIVSGYKMETRYPQLYLKQKIRGK